MFIISVDLLIDFFFNIPLTRILIWFIAILSVLRVSDFLSNVFLLLNKERTLIYIRLSACLIGLVYVLFNIFMLSMSIVLSGFSAVIIIPYAILRLMKPPDGTAVGAYGYLGILIGSIIGLVVGALKNDTTWLVTVASLTMALMSMLHMPFLEGDTYKEILKSHYKLPDRDSCDKHWMTRLKLIIKRLWNNKFMFGFMMIFAYISWDMFGSFDSGSKEQFYALFPGTIGILIAFFWARYMYNGIPDTTFIADIISFLKTLWKKMKEATDDSDGTPVVPSDDDPIQTPVTMSNVTNQTHITTSDDPIKNPVTTSDIQNQTPIDMIDVPEPHNE